MDIIHNNIHMDMVKCRAVSQMTLEDDMNLPQDNPDLDKIIFREGTLNLTDTVVTNDHVLVKGQLLVTVLFPLPTPPKSPNTIYAPVLSDRNSSSLR